MCKKSIHTIEDDWRVMMTQTAGQTEAGLVHCACTKCLEVSQATHSPSERRRQQAISWLHPTVGEVIYLADNVFLAWQNTDTLLSLTCTPAPLRGTAGSVQIGHTGRPGQCLSLGRSKNPAAQVSFQNGGRNGQ